MALTTAQQALLLFKKWLGLGQTTASREFFNETLYPGRVSVYPAQIWTQADQIPNTAPVLSSGQTSGVVQYWQNVTLGAAPGTTNAFTSSLLIDTIPFNYGDGTYNYVVRDSTGTIIPFGQGEWIIDTDAGLLTFYSTVPGNMPPNVSFYKYVGAKGFSSSSVAITASLFGTASWANNATTASFVEYVNVANTPVGLVSSSTQINTGSFSGSFTGNFIGTSSWANTASAILGGTDRYIPLWNGPTSLTSSLLYQTGSSILLGATEQHTPEAPDRFGVFAGVTDSYNLISAHGEIDSYLQLNIKNFSTQSNASSDFVATADTGTEVGGFVNLGINSSNYNIPNAVGNALDAYLYTTGSDLLIGNIANNKKIILFNGEGTALNNARVYIDSIGTVSINTGSATPGNPEALLVKAIAFSYNMITAQADINNYAQVNIFNKNSGNFASSDFVATANNGNEEQYYIAMGINSENFTGDVGLANDAYLYTTGSNLLLGNISPNNKVILFAGDANTTNAAKLIINPNNQHEMTGSLTITGSITVAANVTNQLTASNAISASYAPTILPSNIVSSSTQINYPQLQNIPSGIVSSSTQINTGSFSGSFTGNLVGTGSFATTASFAVTASYVSGAASAWDTISNKPDGLVSSSLQINTGSFSGSFRGTFVGDGSQLTGVVASGVGVTIADNASVQGNASLLDFGNFVTATVSANTASINVALPVGTVSSSQQINTGSFSGSFIGILTGIATNAITASYALNGSGGGATAVTIDTYAFDADGSTVNYVVSQSYNSSSLFVTVNGLGYTHGTDYTISTNTVTFTNAPISSSYIVIRALTNVTSGATGSFYGSFFGNIESSSYTTTASFAISASWAPSSGGTNDWNALINIPSGLVSSSTQASTWTVASSSIATSASYAPLTLPSGVVSSSTQASTWTVASASVATSASYAPTILPDGTVSSSAQTSTWTVASSSVATSASFAPTILPSGVVSSSAQASGWTVASSSVATSASYAPTILPSGIVSSSAQATTWTVATASVATSSSFAISASWAPSAPGAMVPVQDEGTVVVNTPVALNFIGAGVTVTNTSNTASITIPGGSGGDVAAKIVSASYTFGASNEFIFTSGSFTVTLPSAIGIIGREYNIKNISTGVIFITGSSTIDDYSDITITEKNSALGLISNGINWSIF